PAITAGGHAIQNIEEGKPASQDIAEDIPGSIISTAVPATGHAMLHAAARAIPKSTEILQNIAQGKPADAAPTNGPPDDLQAAPPSTAQGPAPPQAPGAGEDVGLRFKNGPPQRGTVDHYFDNGNAVRLRMDDGSVHDLTTADFLKNRTEPPVPREQVPTATMS